MLQSVAVSCSVLQCVAVCCRKLQHVAMCCSVLQSAAAHKKHIHMFVTENEVARVLGRVAVYALQCVAVSCSVLQCVAVCCSASLLSSSTLQFVAVCCSVLQCLFCHIHIYIFIY